MSIFLPQNRCQKAFDRDKKEEALEIVEKRYRNVVTCFCRKIDESPAQKGSFVMKRGLNKSQGFNDLFLGKRFSGQERLISINSFFTECGNFFIFLCRLCTVFRNRNSMQIFVSECQLGFQTSCL